MIIGFVGGKSELNEKLGQFFEEEYQTTIVRNHDNLDRLDGSDYVFIDISDEDQARWLHDEAGARLIYLEHSSNSSEELQPLKKYCSFSLDSSRGLSRTRRKLEMTLMGCC